MVADMSKKHLSNFTHILFGGDAGGKLPPQSGDGDEQRDCWYPMFHFQLPCVLGSYAMLICRIRFQRCILA